MTQYETDRWKLHGMKGNIVRHMSGGNGNI